MSKSEVATVIEALSGLEASLDSLEARMGDMKKSVAAKAQSEIDSVMEQARQGASKEAEAAIAQARQDAEAEAARIMQEGQSRLSEMRSKIESGTEEAVSHVASAVLKP